MRERMKREKRHVNEKEKEIKKLNDGERKRERENERLVNSMREEKRKKAEIWQRELERKSEIVRGKILLEKKQRKNE